MFCEALKELAAMSTLAYKNVQSVKGFSFDEGRILLHMSVQKTSLNSLIYAEGGYDDDTWRTIYVDKQPRTNNITPPLRRHFAIQLLQGLAYIHSYGIIHSDIKPQNLLITSSNVLKIADFGISQFYTLGKHDTLLKSDRVNTVNYKPPDVLLKLINNESLHYSFDVDIWAAGTVLLEMETGMTPFMGEDWSNKNTLNVIIELLGEYPGYRRRDASGTKMEKVIITSEDRLSVVKDLPLRGVINQMLAYDRLSRISAKQALDGLE